MRISPAGTLPDPQLTVMAGNVPSNFKLGSDQMTMFPQFNIMATLPWFGKLGASGDVQTYSYEASSDNKLSTTLAVICDVKKTYAEIYRLQKSIDLVDYKQALLETVINVAEKQFAVGQVPQQDVFRATAELTMIRSEIIMMSSTLRGSYSKLGGLLGMSIPYIAKVDSLVLPQLQSPDSLEGELATQNPDLSGLRNTELAATSSVYLARKEAFPDINFGFSYGYRGGLMPDGTKALNMMSFEVGMSIPIFYGARQQKIVDEEEFMSNATKSRYVSAEVALLSALRSVYADADAKMKLIPLYRLELIPQYEATYNSSLSSYSVGKTSFAMLIDDLNSLVDVRIDLIAIESAYYSSTAEISKLVGDDAGNYKGAK